MQTGMILLGVALLATTGVALGARAEAAATDAGRAGGAASWSGAEVARLPPATFAAGPARGPHPADPVQGRREFIEHNCYGCHGGLGGGAMGPNLRNVVKEDGGAKVHDVILHGKPHMGMPDWAKHGMSSDEAWIIESYLATLGTPREPRFFIGWKKGGAARQVPPGAR